MLQAVNRKQSFLLRTVFVIFLIIGLLSSLISCSKKEQAAVPLETIRIGAFKGEFAALIWLADSEGFFVKYGLKADVTGYESGVAAVEALMAGNQDIATAADSVFVNKTFEHKTDMAILAEIARSDSFAIVVRKDSGISAPIDLKGRRIALTSQTPSQYFLDRYLVYQHIDPRTVMLVNLPPLKLIEAITEGSIEAVITWEPYVWQIEQKLAGKTISWPAQAEQQFHFLLISASEFTEKRPETAKKLIQALAEAEDLIRKDPIRARQILMQRLSFQEDYLAKVWSKHIIGLSLDQTLLVAMEDKARWAIMKGLVPGAKPLNYLRSIYREPLMSVRPAAVTLYQ